MVLVSGRVHLHGRVWGLNFSVSIQNRDRQRNQIHHVFIPRQAACTGHAWQRSGLACRAVAAANPIVSSWVQGLQCNRVETTSMHDAVVHSFAEALQEHLMPVLLCNVLAAWVSMLASGVAALQLPVRYVVTSESTVLDCVYLVPLISPEEGGPGATSIAKLAALQVRLFPQHQLLSSPAHALSLNCLVTKHLMGGPGCRYFMTGCSNHGTASSAGMTSFAPLRQTEPLQEAWGGL